MVVPLIYNRQQVRTKVLYGKLFSDRKKKILLSVLFYMTKLYTGRGNPAFSRMGRLRNKKAGFPPRSDRKSE